MATLPPFKRGDSFVMNNVYKRDGQGLDLTDYTIESQIRSTDLKFVARLNAALADQKVYPGVFTLTPKEPDTTTWPLGIQVCDIAFTYKGTKISTETFNVPVVEHVTTAIDGATK